MYGNQAKMDLSVSEENYLSEPGVYEGRLESVTAAETKKGKPALIFKFVGRQVTVTGEGQTAPVENAVEGSASLYELPKTDEVQIENQMNRVGVIMSRFVGDETAKNIVGVTDWDSYRKWVINTLGVRYKNVPVVFKMVPDTYNQDNPGVKFPQYKGGMVLKTDVKPSFGLSSKEITEAQQLKLLRANIAAAKAAGTSSVAVQVSGSDERESPIY